LRANVDILPHSIEGRFVGNLLRRINRSTVAHDSCEADFILKSRFHFSFYGSNELCMLP